MSTIIEEIRERLGRYPEAEVEFEESSVTYLPSSPDGFVVRLCVHPGHGDATQEWYSVHYNGSHEEFNRRSAAVMTFGFGLSTGCRLREYSRLGRAYRWVVDWWDQDKQGWKPSWEIIQFTAPFWQFWNRTTMKYLQNRLIDLGNGAAAETA
jgi:hypothetical protein